MPDLQVHHVIFTRVERAYSPRKSSGYQLVYQSPILGSEVTQIEKRLQCFQTHSQVSDRYQFFWTEKDQAVLAKTVPLFQPDRDVIDMEQRDAFLAHALVLSRKEFACVNNDPFAIFEAAERESLFAEDIEQLVSYLRDKAPGENLSASTRKPSEIRYLLEDWMPEELLKFYWLGLQAPALSRQQQSILLIAEDQGSIFSLLSVTLRLLSPNSRAACTFDTYADSCYPATGAFWVVGSRRGNNHSGFLPIRLAEQRLEIKGGDEGLLNPKALACPV